MVAAVLAAAAEERLWPLLLNTGGTDTPTSWYA